METDAPTIDIFWVVKVLLYRPDGEAAAILGGRKTTRLSVLRAYPLTVAGGTHQGFLVRAEGYRWSARASKETVEGIVRPGQFRGEQAWVGRRIEQAFLEGQGFSWKPFLTEQPLTAPEGYVGGGVPVAILTSAEGRFSTGAVRPGIHVWTLAAANSPRVFLTEEAGYRLRAARLWVVPIAPGKSVVIWGNSIRETRPVHGSVNLVVPAPLSLIEALSRKAPLSVVRQVWKNCWSDQGYLSEHDFPLLMPDEAQEVDLNLSVGKLG